MAKNHIAELEKRLWDVADELRANSDLKSSEYSLPVLGLIFLKYADYRFSKQEKILSEKSSSRRKIGKTDYQAAGVMYIPDEARFSYLLNLPEGADIGRAINEAMKAIERENEDLKGVLPKTYNRFKNNQLVELIKLMSSIPDDIEGDAFGKIYEYFLGEFAMNEGSKGGEFFTPTSLVKLIVSVIQPFHGKIFDPACGSGGMFVQSAEFVEEHKKRAIDEISIYGQEKTAETVNLCKMNLAIHGLSGDILQGNSYYEDLHDMVGKFDFVMANPPFNVNKIDKDRIKNDRRRFPFGMPSIDNGNYIWIQLFYSALNEKGRAGFVMANSASDARASELEIRKKLIEDKVVDIMIAVGPNFFYTVTLPCTLWFLDKGKKNTNRKDKILFIDARNIYTQIDRAHREWTPEQIEFIANIVRIYRGENIETIHGSEKLIKEKFPKNKYQDVTGLCKVATLKEIEAQGFSLNPGRYVGVVENKDEDVNFKERLKELNEELEKLNKEAKELEKQIVENITCLCKPSGRQAKILEKK
ncbi:MAG: SAM-dependent DNA methyltransferase [Candidatus Goldbacteria bacterium]|nr:SAM-dependent DNA methyltransferase [Candidatus Goldiibacteriota bacterium]